MVRSASRPVREGKPLKCCGCCEIRAWVNGNIGPNGIPVRTGSGTEVEASGSSWLLVFVWGANIQDESCVMGGLWCRDTGFVRHGTESGVLIEAIGAGVD
jgi:hypothetical protein